MTAHLNPIPSPADPHSAPGDQVGSLPVGNSPLLHLVLPHYAPPGGIFGHKINGASAAVMDAPIGGAEALLGAPVGVRADGGLLGALVEAFRIGHSGPMTNGLMSVGDLGTLSPGGPMALFTGSIER